MQIKIIVLKTMCLQFFFSSFSFSLYAQDSFRFGDQEIFVPPPPGFVRVTNEMTAVAKLVQHMEDPVNETLAYYIHEEDAPIAREGKMPALERTFLLKI